MLNYKTNCMPTTGMGYLCACRAFSYAPWHIIPADDKSSARYLVAKIIYEKMVQYTNITEPLPDDNLLKNLEIYKEKLSKKEV